MKVFHPKFKVHQNICPSQFFVVCVSGSPCWDTFWFHRLVNVDSKCLCFCFVFFSPWSELTFWFHFKEHLNRHELQRFYSLRQITSELGRGRAWLRCALNEHSLERYLHTLLADRPRLGSVSFIQGTSDWRDLTFTDLHKCHHSICPPPHVPLIWFAFFPPARTYYEDWAFVLDEERASMLPTMAAGEN